MLLRSRKSFSSSQITLSFPSICCIVARGADRVISFGSLHPCVTGEDEKSTSLYGVEHSFIISCTRDSTSCASASHQNLTLLSLVPELSPKDSELLLDTHDAGAPFAVLLQVEVGYDRNLDHKWCLLPRLHQVIFLPIEQSCRTPQR